MSDDLIRPMKSLKASWRFRQKVQQHPRPLIQLRFNRVGQLEQGQFFFHLSAEDSQKQLLTARLAALVSAEKYYCSY